MFPGARASQQGKSEVSSKHMSAFATPTNAARVSVVAGTFVLAAKALAWRWTGSVALMSDALESIVNVVAAGLVAWALAFAKQPADDEHPWGHGKAEYFSAGVEGTLVVVAAFAIVREAIAALRLPGLRLELGAGLVVSVLASLVNLGLGLWLRQVARVNGSPAILADSKHVLADVATTGGSLVGIALAKASGLLWLDPLIAIGVAVHLLNEGVHVVRGAASALLDESAGVDELARLRGVLDAELLPSESYHDLRSRRAGARLFVEIHLVVAAELTVLEAHDRCDLLEAVVAAAMPGAELTVHVEPDVEPHSSPSPSAPSSS